MIAGVHLEVREVAVHAQLHLSPVRVGYDDRREARVVSTQLGEGRVNLVAAD